MLSRCIGVMLVAIVLLAGAVTGCAPGGQSLLDRLNLKGEARYTVGDQVYAVTEIGNDQRRFELSLARRFPEGEVSEDDLEAISDIDGIMLVSGDGDEITLSGVALKPRAGENGKGYVILTFDIASDEFLEKTWMLEWPDHDSLKVNDPAMNAGI